jgi:hypothetical protein
LGIAVFAYKRLKSDKNRVEKLFLAYSANIDITESPLLMRERVSARMGATLS